MTLLVQIRSHDLILLPRSFQLNCLHQVVLFFKKNEYSCTKLFLINFIGYGCPIFHKIGNARGLMASKLEMLLILGEIPLRLDNIGKKLSYICIALSKTLTESFLKCLNNKISIN